MASQAAQYSWTHMIDLYIIIMPKEQLARLHKAAITQDTGTGNYNSAPVQQQKRVTDCGLFNIAFADIMGQ